MRPLRGQTSVLFAIGAALVFGSAALAHDGATGIVKERMELMKGLGGAMKTIGRMIKGQAPMDRAALGQAIAAIEASTGAAMTETFPHGSNPHPSEARLIVWERFDEFEALADKSREAARALAAAAEAQNDLRAIFTTLADSCKTCHEIFREPGD